MMTTETAESTEQFLSGGGEMGKLIRTMDWSKTPLGPISDWPQSLRTSVSLCLSSTFPILIAWGPETIQIYNDSYVPICGAKHPESMGQNFRVCWETALPVVGEKFARGEQGEGTYLTDQQMFLDRYGYLEESFMTFSFAPIRDESGGVGGIFHPITETTEKMLSARRTQVLRDLGAAISKAKKIQEIGQLTLSHYSAYQHDIPFLLFYECKDGQLELLTAAGIDKGTALAAQTISLPDTVWPIQQVIDSGEPQQLTRLENYFGDFSSGPYPETPHTAVVLPVRISGQAEIFGFLIAGVSARRALDNGYLNFYDQLAATYTTAITTIYAYEQEQKRAEALAEIDRSKTTFFSNVSHEFRTPLTLMLGPLEELMQQSNLDPLSRDHVAATHRNALRLLKLVNNLLDYSRVEAGRIQAVYEPADLCEMTTDLASSFRSIIEKAGMKLDVHCDPPGDTFYVDRQLWEKIVLNLISNAFKYTLEGSISVDLRQEAQEAVLTITDTGVGIPENELPHMFERFHRVENSAGRSHEGTGIGLSLVHELVHLHGGTISVVSTLGQGAEFKVRIPAGKAHLPAEQVVENKRIADSSSIKGAFIKEAYDLLQQDELPDDQSIRRNTSDLSSHHELSSDKQTRILITDDNHDMRNYLRRLLDPYFSVETAVNGQDALEQIAIRQPDLVLSDIMMPVLDGKAMLQQLRADKKTARLPVIFLSARAGEEARIDGLVAGADDYLVKPFSSVELLTKVRAQINISKTRGHAERQLRSLLINAPVAMAMYRGPLYIVEMANEMMLHNWGRTEEEIIGKPLLQSIPELIPQGYKDIMDQVYQTGERFISGEVPVTFNRFGQAETIYFQVTIQALREIDEQITGLIAVATDVTEQVIARKNLEQVNSTLGLAIEAANMGIWQRDVKTDALQLSETARHIHRLPDDLEISYPAAIAAMVVSEDRTRLTEAINTAVQNKSRFNEDFQIEPFDHSARKWINTTGMVELDAQGEVSAVIGTILDISESKADELRKNDFIGMVSHELKTPLTSLVGYTQLGLRNAKKKEDSFNASIYEKTATQLRKMSSMINGFLNVSQLESGKISLNTITFRLDELIREMVADVSLTSGSQQFVIEASEMILQADYDKIGTVITNLLSNAVKYGAKDQPVTITCSQVGNMARLSVTDLGIGIKKADLDKLFNRFYRVETQQTQHISGFGIGLYLSSEIVKRHQGNIWAESEAGKGTTFFIELPLASPLT
jgi:PAS domain S-box-containing protein